MSGTKDKKNVTGPESSDPQGTAGGVGIVPAPSRSTSCVGLSSRFAESLEGETAISVGARGLARALGMKKAQEGRKSIHQDSGKATGPDAPTPGPSRSGSTTSSAFKRPGQKTSKEVQKMVEESNPLPSYEDECLSEAMSEVMLSEEEGDVIFSGDSSDTSRVDPPKKAKRGRPQTTGEWVGVEAVRRELRELKKEHERVVAERDVLAGKLETTFEATAGGVPSADDFYEEMRGETVDSLLNTMLETLQAVDNVADRSGNLKGTLKSVLRHSARRGVAASKLMFTRATAQVASGTEAGEADRYRRDLKAAKGMIHEAEEKIRKLETEVRILKAKETLRARSSANRDSQPRRKPRVHMRISSDEDAMDMDTSGAGPSTSEVTSKRRPKKKGQEPQEGVPPPPSFDWIEQVVERVLTRLRPPAVDPVVDPPSSTEHSVERLAGRKRVRPLSTEEKSTPSGPKAKRKKRRSKAVIASPKKGKKKSSDTDAVSKKPAKKKKRKKAKTGVVREPKTAAVLVSVAPTASVTMADFLRKSRSVATGIPGLSPVSVKKGRAGGTLIQLGGGEGRKHAEELASKMQVLSRREKGVKVICPQKRAELRLTGLDVSVTQREIVQSIAEVAGCAEAEIQVGVIRDASNRSGSCWIRCPVAVNNKLIELGKWNIGWSRVTAKPLPARPMRCFKCLEVGHAIAFCKGTDRSGRCYRCGKTSHVAKDCDSKVPNCPLCGEFGLPSNHVLGAACCVPNQRAAERKRTALAKTGRLKESAKISRGIAVGDQQVSAPKRIRLGSVEQLVDVVMADREASREISDEPSTSGTVKKKTGKK